MNFNHGKCIILLYLIDRGVSMQLIINRIERDRFGVFLPVCSSCANSMQTFDCTMTTNPKNVSRTTFTQFSLLKKN